MSEVKSLSEYTVVQLKYFLGRLELSTYGTKAELIQRLTAANVAAGREINCVPPATEDDMSEPQETSEELPEGTRSIASASGPLTHTQVVPEVFQREMDLLRREKDLLERELRLVRREASASPNISFPSMSGQWPTSTINVKAIGDLLSEFHGDESYQKWSEQIELLRTTYHLDDNSTRILIGSKLRGRALSWFQSKSDHLRLSANELLEQMKLMFDIRPNKLAMKKEFEKRTWQSKESFCDYFHDKIILANRVLIDEEEIVDYIIDGIPDVNLQDQARMHSFDNKNKLLEAFKKLTLRTDFKNRQERNSTFTKGQKQFIPQRASSGEAASRRPPRICFNCQEPGHISTECKQPKKHASKHCFTCGSTTHQKQDCPKKTPTPETTTNVIQAIPSSLPYMVPVKYKVLDGCGNLCDYSVKAIIDTGSPISLIRDSYVPSHARIPASSDDTSYCGINGTPLKITGMFKTEIAVEDIVLTIEFFVVPDETMTFAVLLGRDFVASPSVDISFGKSLVISKTNEKVANELDNFSEQIMHIHYVEKPENVVDTLNINPCIDSASKIELEEIYKNEFVANDIVDSSTTSAEMVIALKHEQPISFRPRRLAFSDKEKLRKILDDLLENGIIRPSNSPYASPIVLVHKKNGELRLCIDFRELNKITIKDNFPTPLIDDHLDRLRNKRFYSSLDLRNGFYHVRMAESSVKYTSFVTPLGQFEYLKMPFGLTNAPRVFQRYVNGVFSHLVNANKILIYLDDILIATEDLDEHLEILREVFRIAKQNNLKFRLDKCSFLYEEITYLGYAINRDGVRPSMANIESVVNYPVPRNIREVHRFVCLASYFRRFIKNFSILAKPLYDLVKKNADFCFGPDENYAFELLKGLLSSQPILAIYSPKLKTELHCDASASGLGAILLQKQADGNLRPVSYFSCRTTPAESRYHSFELECLAAVYAIRRFHVYLSGIPFKIITDCDSFRMTLSKQTVNQRISRWAMFLQAYDFQIEHRPNKRMSHVDALSRCHSVLVLEANTFEQVLSIKQNQDEEIRKLRDELETSESKLFELRDGLVYRKFRNNKLLFFVPTSMENNVIRSCHDNLGHVGVDKTVENISRVYWFPQLREKVKGYILNCLKCIDFSPPSGKTEGYLHSIPKGDLPFHTIHIDHYGPLEKTGKGYKYVFSVIDAFTKFIRLYPCKSTKSEEVIKHLKEYFHTYSKPFRVISDRGTTFTSKLFENIMTEYEINHVLIAVGTPRANGQVERYNRIITPMLAKLSESPEKWDRVLCDVEFALNNTVCRATGKTPSILLFGINQEGKVTDKIRLVLNSLSSNERDLEVLRKSATENIVREQSANEHHYNLRRKKATKYNVGDYVVIRNTDVTPGVNKKLIPKYKGPYAIKKVLDADRYIVEDIEGFQVTQIPFTGTVGPDQMKRWLHD